jgi:hypothetical protein
VNPATGNWYRWDGSILRLEILVKPRAKGDGPGGLHGGRLRLALKAPPVDGAANQHLVEWLAGDPRGAVKILRGEKGRRKTVEVGVPGRLPPWFVELGGTAPRT